MEEEVADAVHKLKNGQTAGATGMKAEHLKEWLIQARPTEEGVEPNDDVVALWEEKVLELVVKLMFVLCIKLKY